MNLGQIGRKVAALLTRRPAPSAVESQMRHDWDQRARENALYYIATDSADSEETFTASGEQSVQAILEDIDALLPSKGVVLEIGCGVGRMLRPLACRFGAVYGLDVSPEMISRARARLADLRNVQLWANGGIDLKPVKSEQVDLAISYLVFQHIPEASVVEAIIQDTFRVLKPGGVSSFRSPGGRTRRKPRQGKGRAGKTPGLESVSRTPRFGPWWRRPASKCCRPTVTNHLTAAFSFGLSPRSSRTGAADLREPPKPPFGPSNRDRQIH